MRTLLSFLLLLLTPLLAHAQSAPVPGSRTLKTFNFEEIALGNFESTPMYWKKVGGAESKGYPAYSNGAFDRTLFHSSNTSFQLHTEGGSVAYRFVPPADKRIPVQPNADYYILASVRSEGLAHARADLVAWFTDDQGNLQLSTETHSQPFHPQNTPDDAWQVLYIYMPGPIEPADAPPKNRSLALQVGLLQPQQLPPGENKLGKFAIYQQDIKGSVWFDDIVVLQLPRIAISARTPEKSTAPTGMFSPDDQIQLDLLVSDLAKTGPDAAKPNLQARLRITDPDNLLYANEQWQAAPTAEKAWTFRYTHAPLPAGLYTATLEIFDNTSQNQPLIARRQTQFLSLPTGPALLPAPEYGLGAASWTNASVWPDLPAYLRQTGMGTIQLPVWRYAMTEDALTRRDPPFDNLLASLQRQNIRAIGAFSELPAVISSRIKADDADGTKVRKDSMIALLGADLALWRPYMSFVLTRYANRIDMWQMGSPDVSFSGNFPDIAVNRPTGVPMTQRTADFYGRLYPEIANLLPQPQLVIPWNALFEFTPSQFPHAVLDLRLPALIKPSQIPAYLTSFRRPQTPLIVHLEGLDARNSARTERLADFAQRVVYTRTSAPETVLYDITQGQPDELLLVYRTMARALAGSTFTCELPLAPGIRAFLFKKPLGSTLVLWNDSATSREVPLDLPLGSSPKTTDLLGNPRVLTTDSTTHLTHLNVTSMPMAIEQIDSRPLQLAASFAISTPKLPAGAGSIRTEVILQNSYAEPVSGMLRLNLPSRWAADPGSFPVSLAAGGSIRVPFSLRYPFNETAGPKTLAARLTLDPGNPTGLASLDLTYPVSIGSDEIEMDCFTVVQANGDILLQQVITNTSKTALNAEAYALVPGFQRRARFITDLRPGETTIKRFVFSAGEYTAPDGGSPSPTKSVATLGVRQNDGRTLLTRSVPFE